MLEEEVAHASHRHYVKGTVFACWSGCWSSQGVLATGPSPEYLTLLEVAKAEGKATIGGFAFDPEEIVTLEKGFKKRFGFALKLIHDPTHIRDLPPKVIAGGFDVVELNVAGGHQILESPRGLVQVEWSMFAPEFPQLDTINRQRPAEDTPCLLYLNGIFGIVYNTKLVKEQELPDTLETSPTPSGRAASSCGTTAILDFIARSTAKSVPSNSPVSSRRINPS
jgi:hypothetical protein